MKNFLKKHIGIVVLLAIIFAFPVSLSTQARLNMRVIVTGLAIDKLDDGFEITAQIVKTSPSNESAGTGASISFISDKGETLISALSKLSYKSGKVAGFSHTNFILIGKDMLEENLLKSLDYFLRDTRIKDSVMILVSQDSAKDEIQKTKDIELSVGVGLQKVFVYKEKESNGKMTTLLSFVNESLNESKTSLVSVLSFSDGASASKSGSSSQKSESSGEAEGEKNENSKPEENSEDNNSAGGEDSTGGSGGKSKSSDTGSDGGEGGGESGETSSSGGSEQYFESLTPLACFVSGKFVGLLQNEPEILGYMLALDKSKLEDVSLESVSFGALKDAKIGVDIKSKTVLKRVDFNGNTPVLNIEIQVKNASIKEIQSDEFVGVITNDEFDFIKEKLAEKISSTIALSFEKAKTFGADIFGSYDISNKYHSKITKQNYSSLDEFLANLKLNVVVKISRLEY